MISKMPRFKCEFGYVMPMSNNDIAYGKLNERIFTFNDIEFFLKIMSPFNSVEWISHIKRMKKGMDYCIHFDETTECGTIKKVIKIKRNG